jgi:hypothetical protein
MARKPAPAVDDALYRVPPAEFTAARKRLVDRLRAAGAADAARAAAKLRKLTAALWAVNQAARRGRGDLTELLRSIDRLKLSRGKTPADLRASLARQRETLDNLLTVARAALASIDAPGTPATMARIAATLTAAAADPALRRDLTAGRLTEERTAPGFDVFASCA